jgi:hypothetical protein
MVGMRTRLAIERAGTVTPHLKRGAPVLYPNPRGNGEQTDRQNLRSTAPVLDPTFGNTGQNRPGDPRAFYAQSLRSGVPPKQWAHGSAIPSWRSGNTHGFCVTGGHPPIASEPTPSPRLWATPPGATPARLCHHNMRILLDPSKEELSTLVGIGTFYFGPTGKSWKRRCRPAITALQQKFVIS